MALSQLPSELLLCVGQNLESVKDVTNFALTCRRLYSFLDHFNRHLYKAQKDPKSALHWAAEHGSYGVARLAIMHGAEVNVREPPPFPTIPLHLACKGGHVRIVALLLEHGADINGLVTNWFPTPLGIAINCCQVPVVRFLLEQKPAPDLTQLVTEYADFRGATYLHMACYYSHASIVQLLIDKGQNVDGRDAQDMRPLHYALRVGRGQRGNRRARKDQDIVDIVRVLLVNGADIFQSDVLGQTPRRLAAKHPIKAVQQMVAHVPDSVSLRGVRVLSAPRSGGGRRFVIEREHWSSRSADSQDTIRELLRKAAKDDLEKDLVENRSKAADAKTTPSRSCTTAGKEVRMHRQPPPRQVSKHSHHEN